MNNVKSLSIILLISLGLVSPSLAKSDCNTDCDTSCSDSCDDSGDCNDSCDDNCGSSHGRTSTFFRPRSVTGDLTYRNNMSFYNKYHDARCNFFTWDTSVIYSQSRKGKSLGSGFLCANPFKVTEVAGADFAALNLQLSKLDTTATPPAPSFASTFSICPERKTISWLNQLYFNLDFFWTGLWGTVDFAVVNAKHKLNSNEVIANGPSDLRNASNGDGSAASNAALAALPANVTEALNGLNTFSSDSSHTGVDDVWFRLGYDYSYSSNDHVGIYLLGVAPTGKAFDNSRWFQPLVGSKHGAVGVGLTGDYTLWSDEQDASDLVFQTELQYQYRLRHSEVRTFDYNCGPCSRFNLVVEKSESTTTPETNNTIAVPGIDNLRACVRVEPRHEIQWWSNFHYQWCNWGAEISYNLWWRDRENISDSNNFDFGNFGIFSFCCPDATAPLTSQTGSCRKTSDQPAGTASNDTTNPCIQDATFTNIVAKDVNLCSGAAQRVLTHKVAGAVSYNSVWCDCYPFLVGFGAGYEFASKKDARHALENWHVQGKFDVSF